MARLIVHLDEGPNTFVLNGERATIGRDHSCDIRILHKAVAPLHCVIQKEDDSYVVEQLDPDFYTLLNGSVLTRGVLRDSDRLEIAKFVIEFHDDPDFAHDAPFFEPVEELLRGLADKAPDAENTPPVQPAASTQPLQSDPVSDPPAPPSPDPDESVAAQPVSEDLPPDSPRTPEPAAHEDGSWYVTRDDAEAGPFTIETLVRMIDEEDITPDTLLRGPTNPIRAKPASRVRGVARFFESCHACRAHVTSDQVFCHNCGENLTHVFVQRGAGPPPLIRRSSPVARPMKTVLILLVALSIPVALYASGLWREFVPDAAQIAVDTRVEKALTFLARIVGPERFSRYRRIRDLAVTSAETQDFARAAELYDEIETAFPGTRFAEDAARRRRDALADLYSQANEAAGRGDYAAAVDKLAAASLDPSFFTLYPAAESRLARWRSLSDARRSPSP